MCTYVVADAIENVSPASISIFHWQNSIRSVLMLCQVTSQAIDHDRIATLTYKATWIATLT